MATIASALPLPDASSHRAFLAAFRTAFSSCTGDVRGCAPSLTKFCSRFSIFGWNDLKGAVVDPRPSPTMNRCPASRNVALVQFEVAERLVKGIGVAC